MKKDCVHIMPIPKFNESGKNKYLVMHFDKRGGWQSTSHENSKEDAKKEMRRLKRVLNKQ